MGINVMDWLFLVISFLVVTAYVFYKLIVKYKRVSDIGRRPVLVTGCDSGFGYALVIRLINLRVPVIATCLFESSCETFNALYKNCASVSNNNDGTKLLALQMDVSSSKSVQSVVDTVKARFPQGLWGLVCNAGILGKPCPDDWLIPEDFMDTINVNLIGSIRCVQMFKPMLRQMQGRILFTGSVTMKIGLPGIAPYTVSKFGIEGYSQTLRHEIRPQRIKVIIIEPGFHGTSLSNADVIHKSIDQCWARLSPYYKELYGEGYEEKMFNSITTGLLSKNSNDLSWILDSFEHALLAQFPEYRYRVGWDAITQFHPLSLLPDKVQDLAIDLWYYLLKVPYPEYTNYL